jgi:hypothetical protein
MQESDVGGICDTRGGEDKCMQVFIGLLEDVSLDGRLKIEWFLKK